MGLLCVDALLALVGEYCCNKLCLSPAIFRVNFVVESAAIHEPIALPYLS